MSDEHRPPFSSPPNEDADAARRPEDSAKDAGPGASTVDDPRGRPALDGGATPRETEIPRAGASGTPANGTPQPGDHPELGATTGPVDPATADVGPTPAAERAGKGRFTVLRPHARGGLGQVSLARDEDLNREVALKEIRPEHYDNPAARERFVNEAAITGQLEHPGVVPVYALGRDADGRPYYAMRFVHGRTLAQAIADYHAGQDRATRAGSTNLAFRELLRRFVDTCQAMAYAHSKEIIHRDLKPANIMLGKYGETLILDWGLAKRVGTRDVALCAGSDAGSVSSLTQAGQVLGTPAYMSPEQAAGQAGRVGPATDIYALGSILYEMLTGRPPYRGTAGEVLARLRQGPPPPAQLRPGVPRALEAVCLKAMARSPAQRYPSAAELAQEIERWLADEPVTAYRESAAARLARWTRRHKVVVAGGAVLMLASIIGLVVNNILVHQEKARTEIEKEEKVLALGRAERNEKQATVNAASAEREATRARNAERQAKQAEGAAKDNEEKARRFAAEMQRQADLAQRGEYAAQLFYAQRTLDTGEAPFQVLDDLRRRLGPSRVGGDLRGFDWFHLWARCHGERLRLDHAAVQDVHFSPDGRTLATSSGEGADDTRLWDAASGRQRVVLPGQVQVVLFARDGRTLITSDRRQRFVRWDVSTGRRLEEVTMLRGTGNPALSPDGKTLATVAPAGVVKLWNTATWREQGRVNWYFLDGVNRVAFSPDGRTLAVATGGLSLSPFPGTTNPFARPPEIKIWDRAAGMFRATLGGYNGTVSRLLFSPDGKTLAAVSGTLMNPAEVRLWNTETWNLRALLPAQEASVAIAFAPDSKLLATAKSGAVLPTTPLAERRAVQLWDPRTGRRLGALEGHAADVTAVEFSPDGTLLASAADDFSIRLWDVGRRQPRGVLLGHRRKVTRLVFAPDGKSLASLDDDANQVKVWSVGQAPGQMLLPGHKGGTLAVAFSPDEKLLATGGVDGRLRLWNPQTGALLAELEGQRLPVRALVFSPDGKLMATCNGEMSFGGSVHRDEMGEVFLWDVAGRKLRTRFQAHASAGMQMNWVTALAFSRDGTLLATASNDRTVKLWDVGTLRVVRTLPAEPNAVVAVAFSPDGRLLASAAKVADTPPPPGTFRLQDPGQPSVVSLWELATGRLLRQLDGPVPALSHLVFAADGRTLAAGSRSAPVRLWDVSTGKVSRTLEVLGDHVAFSPDGKVLLVAGHKAVALQDRVTLQSRMILRTQEWPISSLAVAPSGNLLGAGIGQASSNVVSQYGPEDRPPIVVWRAAPAATVAAAEQWAAETKKRRRQLADAAQRAARADKEQARQRQLATEANAAAAGEARALLDRANRLSATGLVEEAAAVYARAEADFARIAREHPVVAALQDERAGCLRRLADLYRKAGRATDAARVYQKALSVQQALVDEFPRDTRLQGNLGAILNDFGLLRSEQKQWAEARRLFELAIAHQRAAGGSPAPMEQVQPDPNAHRLLRDHYGNLTNVLLATGDHRLAAAVSLRLPEALPGDWPTLRDALTLVARSAEHAGADNRLPAAERARLARTYLDEAAALILVPVNETPALMQQGQMDTAEAVLQECRKALAPLHERSPKARRCRFVLARIEFFLGALRERDKQLPQAKEAYQKAAALLRPVAAEAGDVTDHHFLGQVLHSLAVRWYADQDAVQALKHAEEAVREQSLAHRAAPSNQIYSQLLVKHYLLLAAIRLHQGDHGAAATAAAELLQSVTDGWEAQYVAANILTNCLLTVEKDTRLSVERRKARAAAYAGPALDAMDRAVDRLQEEAHRPPVMTIEQLMAARQGQDPDARLMTPQRDLGRRYVAFAGQYVVWQQYPAAIRIYGRAVALFERLMLHQSRPPGLPAEVAAAHNGLAWLLVAAPDERLHDARRAVTSAQRAVQLAPKTAVFWNTLGVAHYRAGRWKESIEALRKSLDLGSPSPAADWFFLAMAHRKLDRKAEARRWYDRAVGWMEKNQSADEELRRFRGQAAAVLGVRDKPGSTPSKSE
jgi:WD40 repeat protein/tetratricopeptide (TPR) repeat protein/tRNA A-37 threonylcarbamoyl transferase component Bud32